MTKRKVQNEVGFDVQSNNCTNHKAPAFTDSEIELCLALKATLDADSKIVQIPDCEPGYVKLLDQQVGGLFVVEKKHYVWFCWKILFWYSRTTKEVLSRGVRKSGYMFMALTHPRNTRASPTQI